MDVHSYSKNASWELRYNFYFNYIFNIRKKIKNRLLAIGLKYRYNDTILFYRHF